MSLWNKKRGKDIDLVLSSSGVRAPCFIGALEALKEKQYNICRIAGSSGGAIVAAAYALGMNTQEMRGLASTIPYDRMRDFRLKNIFSLHNPSVYTGEELDAFYQSLFGNAQMKDFGIECRISVVTILERKRILIDKYSHPSLPVWKAVRMSSTIPFIFPYYKLDGMAVTDGGLVTGMFDIFDEKLRPVIGLRPRADHGFKKTIQDVKASKLFIWNYLKILAEYFIDAIDNQHIPEVEWNRTIVIPTFQLGGFNFYLTSEDINQLIKYGYNAVMASELALLK